MSQPVFDALVGGFAEIDGVRVTLAPKGVCAANSWPLRCYGLDYTFEGTFEGGRLVGLFVDAGPVRRIRKLFRRSS